MKSDFFQNVVNSFEQEASRFQRVDATWLKNYRREYNRDQLLLQKYKQEQSQSTHKRTMAHFENRSLTKLTWSQYVALLNRHRELSDRLEMLHLVRARWHNANRLFSRIPLTERLEIAGIPDPKSTASKELDWYMFGDMTRVSQKYRARVIRVSKSWDGALLRSLNLGDLTEHDLVGLWRTFRVTGIHRARITRMLAMSRPDLFVPVTGKNLQGLAAALGNDFPRDIRTPNLYWQRVVEPLRNSPWWLHPEGNLSNDIEREIWQSRMALVDLLVYDPN